MKILKSGYLFSIRTRPAAANLAVIRPPAKKVWRPLVLITVAQFASRKCFLTVVS